MLTIRGHSDDIVEANIDLERACPCCGAEVEEPKRAVVGGSGDEIGAYEKKVHLVIGDEKGGVAVTMSYEGCWAATVVQLGEDIPIPWEVKIGAEGYTVVVTVDCPDGTQVKVEEKST